MSDQPTPKIIVDEDWKAQAQAEKEAAERARAAAKGDSSAESAESTAGEQAAAPEPTSSSPKSPDATKETTAAEEAKGDDPPLPAPSLELLIGTLATQAMASLGFLPDPIENKQVVRLNQAKHAIDMLGVLEEKTKGNLTAEEGHMLSDALHQLRLAFVAAKSQHPGK